MHRPLQFAVPWLAALMGCSGGSSSGPAAPPFTVVVSLNANLSGSEALALYDTEFQAIAGVGARGAQTAAPWAALNPTGTTYDLTMLSNPFFGTAALAGHGFTTILLNIPVIAVAARAMPADISGLPFDDATVKARYRALLDQVVPYLNDQVVYVSLGNEVDTYLSANPGEWLAYRDLIEDARAHLKAQKPAIRVGVTTTFDGATGAQAGNVAVLNANMDVVVLTYYPIDGMTFMPRPPSTVANDFAAMVMVAGNKPLVMQEWGYPTSASLSSSPALQADFLARTFTEWRRHGGTRVPFISFFKLRDWDPAHCTTLTGGQTAGQPFFEFLCSLGLLDNGGTQKPAYQELVLGIATIGI